MDFKIPIIKNTIFDLSKFNFSFVDIKIIDTQSSSFNRFIKKLNPEFYDGNFSFFNEINSKINFEKDRCYAIVKNNYKTNYSEDDIYAVFKILKVIFPSGLEISHIVNFKEENNFVQRTRMSSFENKYYDETEYLNCNILQIKKTNQFIKQVFKNFNKNFYLKLSIENYISSFNASHIHFSYIALCIALENLIDGKNELIYRLKRLIAIICGNDRESCQLIFLNINEIYILRSKIVHGDDYNPEKIYEFLEYLKSIVSLTITELLIHNIKDNIELNAKVTILGYGQKKLISKNRKIIGLNCKTLEIIKNKKLSLK